MNVAQINLTIEGSLLNKFDLEIRERMIMKCIVEQIIKRINQNGSKISMHYYKDSARFCSIQKGMYRHWCEQHSLSK